MKESLRWTLLLGFPLAFAAVFAAAGGLVAAQYTELTFEIVTIDSRPPWPIKTNYWFQDPREVYAGLATNDDMLEQVAVDGELSASVAELRSHVRVALPDGPSNVVLVTVSDTESERAQRLAEGLALRLEEWDEDEQVSMPARANVAPLRAPLIGETPVTLVVPFAAAVGFLLGVVAGVVPFVGARL